MIYNAPLLLGISHKLFNDLLVDTRNSSKTDLDTELACERLALCSDTRIPRECLEYKDTLCNPQATYRVKVDCIKMLSRFVSFAGSYPQQWEG